MFYKYCGFSGKVVPSTQMSAYQPQGLMPYSGKVTQLVFDSSRTQVLRESEGPYQGSAPARGAATAPPPPAAGSQSGAPRGLVPNNPGYRKVMEMQTIMTRDDGKFVWQKTGRDRMGYYVSLGVMAVGTAMCLHLLYKMSFPKKKEE